MIRGLIAVAVGALVTGLAWFAVDGVEAAVQQQVAAEQLVRVQQVAELRADQLHRVVEGMGLFADRRTITGQEFTPYLNAVYASHEPLFRTVAWLPVVEDRASFEAHIRELNPTVAFQITERTPEGTLQPAGAAKAWVPFLLVQPPHLNTELRGMDLGNQPMLAETMQRAHLRGVAMAPQNTYPGSDAPSFLMLRYVADPNGFMGVVFSVQGLLEHLLAGRPAGLVASLTDETSHEPLLTEAGFTEAAAATHSLTLGGRHLVLKLAPGPDYQPIRIDGRQGVLFGGAGLTLVLVAFALLGAPPGTR